MCIGCWKHLSFFIEVQDVQLQLSVKLAWFSQPTDMISVGSSMARFMKAAKPPRHLSIPEAPRKEFGISFSGAGWSHSYVLLSWNRWIIVFKVNMRRWYHLLYCKYWIDFGWFWYAIHILVILPHHTCSWSRFSSKDQSQESDESDCRKVMGGTMSTECPPSRRQTRTDLSRNIEVKEATLEFFCSQFSMYWHLRRVTNMCLR